MSILRILAVSLLLMGATPVMAQEAVPPTCDAGVHDMMKVQARLEGQKELEMAERLILKPDSTLEYSCFTQVAESWGANAGTFSNGGGGFPPGAPPNLRTAIDSLVINPLSPYLENFGHLFLGGTFENEGGAFSDQLAGTDGQCNTHHWIWFLAKCANSNPVHFFELSALVENDWRVYPQSCSGALKTDRDQRITDDQELTRAFPDATRNPPFGVDNASRVTGKTDGDLYTTRLTTCGTPVKTGLKVKPLSGEGTTAVDDAVCVAPGCSYDGSSCSQ